MLGGWPATSGTPAHRRQRCKRGRRLSHLDAVLGGDTHNLRRRQAARCRAAGAIEMAEHLDRLKAGLADDEEAHGAIRVVAITVEAAMRQMDQGPRPHLALALIADECQLALEDVERLVVAIVAMRRHEIAGRDRMLG